MMNDACERDEPALPDSRAALTPEDVSRPATADEECSRASCDLTFLFVALATIGVVFLTLSREELVHCANDASRWNTIYNLVENGTYAFLPEWEMAGQTMRGRTADECEPGQELPPVKIGDYYYERPWDVGPFWTIDMVKVGDNYCSSKPPLLSTCIAGVVWALERVTGRDFKEHPRFIMRTTVILVQVVPFLVMIWLIRRHVFRASDSWFVRNFCIASAALATYLTAYLIPMNNHVIAACTGFFALHAVIRVWYDGKRGWYWFAVAGFFAGLTAGIELPAALFALVLFAALLVKAWKKTLAVGLPLALVPVVLAVLTNYLAVGRITPAYWDVETVGGLYDYPGSYFDPADVDPSMPANMDALEDPRPVYLFHMLIGHHGFFLLTPIFVLSLVGMVVHWLKRSDDGAWPLLAVFVLLLLAAVIGAYMVRGKTSYGGVCQGFRWFFWMIPMWLLMLTAAVDVLGRYRLGRALCYLCLCVSLLSVAYALPHPGKKDALTDHPFTNSSWAYDLFESEGAEP